MARRKGIGCSGVGTFILLGLAYAIYQNPSSKDAAAGTLGIGLIALIAVLLVSGASVPKCQVCKQQLGRRRGFVEIDGKRYKACSNCVRTVQAKTSRAALKKFGI
jgi:hypothetical protein